MSSEKTIGLLNARLWVHVACVIFVVMVFVCYGGMHRFGLSGLETPISIWKSSWNTENDFQHGWFFPPLVVGLLIAKRKELALGVGRGSWFGVCLSVFGGLIFLLAFRATQWRLAVAALPLIFLGGVWALYGFRVARLVAFPLLLTWIAIPVPQFQQATNGLQLIASKLGYFGAKVCGVDGTLKGNVIQMGAGKGFSVDEGCSGIRSLWALLLMVCAWVYLSRMVLWKRALLFLSVIPIAIVGNALRLSSIFLIAEYGSEDFAATTWHDWSSILIFYPLSVLVLFGMSSFLEGTLFRRRRVVVRKVRVGDVRSGDVQAGSEVKEEER